MQLVKLNNAVNVLQDGVAELMEKLADEDKHRRRRRRRVVSSGVADRRRFWVRPMFLRRKTFGKLFHIKYKCINVNCCDFCLFFIATV